VEGGSPETLARAQAVPRSRVFQVTPLEAIDNGDHGLANLPATAGAAVEDARDYLLLIVGHAQEHLGQSIAYARSIGVTPPWSIRPPRPSPASTAEIDGRTARGTIRDKNQLGNLTVSFVDGDFERIGVTEGDFVEIEACGESERVFVGAELFDVRPGEWVLYPSPDGHWSLALSFGNAAQTFGCEGGETIEIRPGE
jgi:hypothetical protein